MNGSQKLPKMSEADHSFASKSVNDSSLVDSLSMIEATAKLLMTVFNKRNSLITVKINS